MTIAVRRSGFTIPLSLVVLTSTAMLLAGCQSGGASDANQQGTTGSSAKAQSTASAAATMATAMCLRKMNGAAMSSRKVVSASISRLRVSVRGIFIIWNVRFP